MPGSKSIKRTCTYKFKQGPKKGKKCNVTCRGQFCFKHKPSTTARKAEWFQEKQKDQKSFKVKKYIKDVELIKDVNKLPNIHKISLKKHSIYYEIIDICKDIQGIDQELGIENKNRTNFLNKSINKFAYNIRDIPLEKVEEIRKHVAKYNYETEKKNNEDNKYKNIKIPKDKLIFYLDKVDDQKFLNDKILHYHNLNCEDGDEAYVEYDYKALEILDDTEKIKRKEKYLEEIDQEVSKLNEDWINEIKYGLALEFYIYDLKKLEKKEDEKLENSRDFAVSKVTDSEIIDYYNTNYTSNRPIFNKYTGIKTKIDETKKQLLSRIEILKKNYKYKSEIYNAIKKREMELT
jgi:hypothetical protein